MKDTPGGDPMRCPHDGAQLNHHATMIRDPLDREEASNIDSTVDGVLIEVHACPTCGRGQPRTPGTIS